ncbi:MAG: protein kinase [Deltaproteobacteria bacterium]|nr:protein kinase [Deltaproteobacteria bacterium]MDQ3296196.1 protein kinase [Myxococcota bacterium]
MGRDQITGRTLGDFVVRNKLGEGGFGAVYRAEQPLLQREAVIKVLHHRLRASEVVIQRFMREARLASQLDHPYAAHVYAFGAEPDGLLWIAMELVRGTPLDALLRAQGTLPIEQLVQLMNRICEVVHTAHEQGIVHRDIKPANVIVLSRAGRLLPKLLDFGIAKALAPELATPGSPGTTRASSPVIAEMAATLGVGLDATQGVGLDATVGREGADDTLDDTLADSSGAESRASVEQIMSQPVAGLTSEGAIVGSPHYMAPEQWVDARSADARTDIYALGVLAYEALTGKPPFNGRTLAEVAVAHAEGVVPPVGEAHAVALDAVFARVFAKQPADRFATALELAVAFRAASGVGSDEREILPQLDETLRDAMIADAPQPIAEAVAAVAAVHTSRQARDAILVLVYVAARVIGLVALACRTRIGSDDGRDTEPIIETLRALRRRLLTDEEWLDLARELCRPYATRPAAFPIPELVTLFFDHDTARPSPLEGALELSGQAGATDEQVRESLARALPELTRFLRSIAFLADYPLVVSRNDRTELWMGVRRLKRAAFATRSLPLSPDHPTLVDRQGRPTLVLWPLFQVHPPSPGAPDELFLFEGKGRHGARFVAMPQELERADDTLWEWFGESLLDTVDQVNPASLADAPYRGLSAFTAGDADLFFGREREIEAFVNRLRTQPLLAVVGPSGAGKSSFVQAGVVPALPESWRVVTVRPGPSPLVALHARLAELLGVTDKRSSTSEAELYALGEQLRRHAGDTNTTIVLVVDQFEELFTLCSDASHRAQYAEALTRAARSAEDPVRIILTLRDDFLLHAEQLAPLRTRLAQGLQLLATPARDDLLRIVTEPARAAGYDFEDRELPAQMVDDVAGRPGALALLSFSGAKLWELRDRHFKQLGRRAYESMGGVGGALAQHAEQTLAGCSPDEQRLVREAFRQLVTAEGTRAVLSRPELLELLGSGARAATVVERLIAARLIVASEGEGGEERLEIIHEALLAAWPRLVDWRREDAEGVRLRDQLRAAARQWEDRRRPRDLLWRAETLTEYQLWRTRHPEAALTDREAAFAAASLAEAARGRRTRRGLLALAFVSLAAVAVALTWFNHEARDQAEQSRHHVVKLYTEQGRRALLDGYRQRALLYLAEAWRRGGRTPALEFLLARAGTALDQQIANLEGHTGPVSDAVFSPDGRTVVTISDDHTARLWDATTGKSLHELRGHRDWVRAVAFAPAGDAVLTVSWDGTARFWDVATGTSRWVVELRSAQSRDQDPHAVMEQLSLPCTADISADGARLIASCVDRRAAVISREGAVESWLEGPEDLIIWTKFAPDGRSVLVTFGAGQAFVFDAHTGTKSVELVGHDGRVVGGTFTDDGSRILTFGRDGSLRSWSPDGKQLATLRGHQGTVWNGRLIPGSNGSHFVTSSTDRTVRVWDLESGQSLATIAHQAPVPALDVSAKLIFSGDQSGVGMLSLIDGRRLAMFEGHDAILTAARFSPDGTRLVTTSTDRTARIWHGQVGDTVERLAGHDGTVAVTGARFSPVEPILFTASQDATIRVWQFENGQARSTIFAKSDHALWSLAISRDGKMIAAGAVDGTIGIWDTRTRRQLHTLRGPSATFSVVAFDPSATVLASGAADGVVSLWDLTNGQKLADLPTENRKAVNMVAFDPRGRQLAVGRVDSVSVWDWRGRRELAPRHRDVGVDDLVYCGERLLVASGVVKALSVDGGFDSVVSQKGQVMAPSCTAGQLISAGGREIEISDVASGTSLFRIEAGADVMAIDVGPDGTIAAAGYDGKVTIVRIDRDNRSPDELAANAKRVLSLKLDADGVMRVTK